MKRLIIVLTITFLLAVSLSVKAENYRQYCNQRYGFCVDYPATLSLEPPPANGDGKRFFDSNGFSMTASGINNVLSDTLTSEMKSQSQNINQITYRTQGKNWFVLSGYKESNIIYLKTYLGKGSINHLWIQYPQSKNKHYSDIVTRISRSFTSGNLNLSH